MAKSVIEKSLAKEVDSLKPTSKFPGFTKANDNITAVERSHVTRSGYLVHVDIAFTVGTIITDTQAVLFTGLPKAYGGTSRFRIYAGYENSVPLELGITVDGNIINQWSQGGVRTGVWHGSFTYISSETA